ncbi:MAG: hypothetical protein GX620_12875 [Chloroflexi bacterium]|nr:hypothetical protein [Chloroflexota bacterium]
MSDVRVMKAIAYRSLTAVPDTVFVTNSLYTVARGNTAFAQFAALFLAEYQQSIRDEERLELLSVADQACFPLRSRAIWLKARTMDRSGLRSAALNEYNRLDSLFSDSELSWQNRHRK